MLVFWKNFEDLISGIDVFNVTKFGKYNEHFLERIASKTLVQNLLIVAWNQR